MQRDLILKYVQQWKRRGYANGIPDVAPRRLEASCRAPSYRAICRAIMKNDVSMCSLGFSRPSSGWYDVIKKDELMRRGKINAAQMTFGGAI